MEFPSVVTCESEEEIDHCVEKRLEPMAPHLILVHPDEKTITHPVEGPMKAENLPFTDEDEPTETPEPIHDEVKVP